MCMLKAWVMKVRCWIRAKWVALMAWFENSETKFIAWVMSFSGVALAVAGAFDFTAITADGLTPKQQISLGVGMALKGLLDYVARKYREKDEA